MSAIGSTVVYHVLQECKITLISMKKPFLNMAILYQGIQRDDLWHRVKAWKQPVTAIT